MGDCAKDKKKQADNIEWTLVCHFGCVALQDQVIQASSQKLETDREWKNLYSPTFCG